MIGSTAEPTGGIPSLTDGEIVQLYQQYLFRGPDSGELASERENAMKYSAAGIERQIANRAGNVGGSGVRGDEGLPSLTVPASHAAAVVTMGPAAIISAPSAAGPTGTIQAYGGGGGSALAPYGYANPYAQPATILGFPLTTVALIAVMAGAAWYFVTRR